ncbi:MAG: GTPase HflX [Bacillota bacterium]
MKKAILIGLDHYKGKKISIYMDELSALANTLHIETDAIFVQDSKLATANYRIGTGKIEEIKMYIDANDIDLAIFNEELTASQIRNLEEALTIPVIDRTLLILDIFAKRAKTKEAMLQVEVAQLKYILPRLKVLSASFERQQGGIGSRGPGEKKIELNRRKIEQEIHKLEKALAQIVDVRQTNRKNRQKSLIKTVAVVGYTNAGKSTLMNKLLEEANVDEGYNVKVKDQLFATLETTSRRIELPNTRPFILTDTIGFVSNLPHELVDSFKSTLEEIKEADLLLHVVDFSNPYYIDQIATTNKVLKELDADQIETLYVFNKLDLTKDSLPFGFAPNVKVSLKDDINIDELIEKIHQLLSKDDKIITYKIPFDKGEIINILSDYSHILTKDYTEEGTIIKALVSNTLRHRYEDYEI